MARKVSGRMKVERDNTTVSSGDYKKRLYGYVPLRSGVYESKGGREAH